MKTGIILSKTKPFQIDEFFRTFGSVGSVLTSEHQKGAFYIIAIIFVKSRNLRIIALIFPFDEFRKPFLLVVYLCCFHIKNQNEWTIEIFGGRIE